MCITHRGLRTPLSVDVGLFHRRQSVDLMGVFHRNRWLTRTLDRERFPITAAGRSSYHSTYQIRTIKELVTYRKLCFVLRRNSNKQTTDTIKTEQTDGYEQHYLTGGMTTLTGRPSDTDAAPVQGFVGSAETHRPLPKTGTSSFATPLTHDQ